MTMYIQDTNRNVVSLESGYYFLEPSGLSAQAPAGGGMSEKSPINGNCALSPQPIDHPVIPPHHSVLLGICIDMATAYPCCRASDQQELPRVPSWADDTESYPIYNPGNSLMGAEMPGGYFMFSRVQGWLCSHGSDWSFAPSLLLCVVSGVLWLP